MKDHFLRSEAVALNRALVGAILLGAGAVSNAHAQSATLYGGGATLPAVGYVGHNAANGGGSSVNSRLSTASGNSGQAGSAPAVEDDASSLFGALYDNDLGFPDISYCQTGSGTGKNVLEGVIHASNICPSLSQSAIGFGAPSGQLQPSFAASDAPMMLSDISTFDNLSSSRTAPLQIPVIASAIAIVYNPTNTGVSTTNTFHLPLTDSQICQIFSGSITNWGQLGYNNEPITVVYDSGSSGTTFNFTNHLAYVCADYLRGPGFFFSTSQTFSAAIATTGEPIPNGAIGANGDPNIVATVQETPGAIGYAELANALAQSPALPHASVEGKGGTKYYDPATAFTSPFPSIATTLSYVTGKVINGANTSMPPFGNPVLVSVTAYDTEPQCIVLVDPNSYANLGNFYPIIAVSYLLGYYSGNGADTSNLQTLLSTPYNSTYQAYAENIGAGTGFAWLNIDLTNVVSSCINS